jgi:large subunit ribosomal protein L10
MPKQKAHVSELKKQKVEELTSLVKNKKTILIASIKNIPGGQFQEIAKKLRGKAIVKVPKKNLIFRALDSSDEQSKEQVEKLKGKIGDAFAILFSDLDAFELAGVLLKNQSPSKAKAGQIAPMDIEIPEGPTELVPGPAISELGALGIQIQIENGKITIKESKVVAEKGKKISQGAADLMTKLGIKPFKIGFIPLCAFDTKENLFYSEIKIDKEGTLADLKYAAGKALPFAVSIGYISKDTVKVMIQRAQAQANKINRIFTGEPEPIAAPAEPANSEQAQKPKEETKSEEEKAADAGAGLASLF